MEPVISSKLKDECQATITEKANGMLNPHISYGVSFEVTKNKKVLIRKATPIDFEFAQALESTLVSEWLSENDEEAYRDL